MRKLKKWVADPVDSTLLQVPRALVVSVLCAIVDCALLALLVEGAGWHSVPACIVSYLAGGILGYTLCSWWVFPNSPANAALGFLAFTILSLGGLGITIAVMAILGDVLHLPWFVAKFFALGLAFSWNFVSRKYLLFKVAGPGSEFEIVSSTPCPHYLQPELDKVS